MIRVADVRDINKLLHIEDMCFKKIDRFSKRQFKYAIEKGAGEIYVIVETFHGNEQLYGYVYLSKGSCIYSIAIHPLFQRDGLARQLIKQCSAVSYPFRALTLYVRLSHRKNFLIYKNLGFEEVRIKERYYKDGEHAVLMRKKGL